MSFKNLTSIRLDGKLRHGGIILSTIYSFTDSMQEKILTVLWRDSNSYFIYRECIKPKYFRKAVHIDLCRIIFEYWDRYEKPPTLDVLVEEVSQLLEKSKTKQNLEEEFIDTLTRMAQMNLEDLEYVKDQIIEFGKKQAMIEAVVEGAEIIEKNGEYEKVEELVKNAVRVGEDNSDIGTFVFENIEERLESYNKEEDVIERIPTSNELLNNIMKGGLGRTEMGVVIAPPGRGKTTFLIDTGSAAVKAGFNVVHYSFENNEKQITRNYDTRLLEKDIEYIKENTEKSVNALLNMNKLRKGQLVVKKYPTKGATINTIRAHLKQLEVVKGFVPDVIIIDYGAIIKPLNSYKEKRNVIEENYEDIRALADEFDAAVWTAAQGNRGSLSKKIVTIADLAEAFAIANTADFMIALCQTPKEKSKGVMRYFIAKQRDGSDHITLSGRVMHDIKKMIMDEVITVDDDMEDEDDWE